MQLIETFFDLIFFMAALSLRSLDYRRQYPADPREIGYAFHGAGVAGYYSHFLNVHHQAEHLSVLQIQIYSFLIVRTTPHNDRGLPRFGQ